MGKFLKIATVPSSRSSPHPGNCRSGPFHKFLINYRYSSRSRSRSLTWHLTSLKYALEMNWFSFFKLAYKPFIERLHPSRFGREIKQKRSARPFFSSGRPADCLRWQSPSKATGPPAPRSTRPFVGNTKGRPFSGIALSRPHGRRRKIVAWG